MGDKLAKITWEDVLEWRLSFEEPDEFVDWLIAHARSLQEQVAHLSQFAHCSKDLHDGIAHGGASICQMCVNKEQARIEELERSWDLAVRDKRLLMHATLDRAAEVTACDDSCCQGCPLCEKAAAILALKETP